MVGQIERPAQPKIIYPESDGQPMADNTIQYGLIVTIHGGVEALSNDNPNVFVAADLLWYPVEGNNKIKIAPDVMVVFGRPKGDRGSYLQWEEENIAPQVVFEILSPSNTLTEMARKFQFYQRYGVEEYYLYDPQRMDLSGWRRVGNELEVIEQIEGWVSPRLGIRFQMGEEGLEIYRPDGQKFATYLELERQKQFAEQRAQQEAQRAEHLAAKLRELGIDPEDV